MDNFESLHDAHAESLIGWFDGTLNADRHMKLPDVLPVNAAMLLCQFDPLEDTLERALVSTNDATCRVDLKTLVSHFEAVSRTDPRHRVLLDWWHIARDAKLKYHPWIDLYIEATGMNAPAQQAGAVAAPMVPVLESTPRHLLADDVQLIAAFGNHTGMKKAWFAKLEDKPELLAARFRPGVGGRNGAKALFHVFPVLEWLIDPKRKTGKSMQSDTGWRLLNSHFPKVYEAFQGYKPETD